jgi:uncharacterized protein YuzE
MNTSYDRSTGSLYIKVRDVPAVTSRVVTDDVIIDLGADGDPVGYDVQYAWQQRQLVARLILGQAPAAAE